MNRTTRRRKTVVDCRRRLQVSDCRNGYLTRIANAIVGDIVRRGVELESVTLEEMKSHLTAAVRYCEKSVAASRSARCA